MIAGVCSSSTSGWTEFAGSILPLLRRPQHMQNKYERKVGKVMLTKQLSFGLRLRNTKRQKASITLNISYTNNVHDASINEIIFYLLQLVIII